MDKLIKKLEEDPNEFAAKAKISSLVKLIKYADEQYYNKGKPIMSDAVYDLLIDALKQRSPKNPALKKIGAPVSQAKQERVKLPFHMGSMDKVKPGKGLLEKWQKKFSGPYVYSDKLDGVSGLFYNGKLYTRGDGSVGTDISHFVNMIPTLSQLKDLPDDLAVRGEFIFKKKVFDKKYSDRTNPRNTVSGFLGRKTLDDDVKKMAKDVEFVAYQIVNPRMEPLKQFQTLKKLGFNTVHYQLIKDLSDEGLSDILDNRNKKSPYEIDGIIVAENKIHKLVKSGNPKHAFAFKDPVQSLSLDVSVMEVEWNISKDGKMKPRVRIDPVQLSGVTVTWATGFNAKFILENKIGPGAIIKLTRSGDVIPHIVEVIKPSKSKKLLPDVPFVWTSSGVDIVYDDTQGDDELDRNMLIKNMTYFLKKMGIKYVSQSSVKRMVDAGIDSVPEMLKATPQVFMNVEGFEERAAQRAYDNIQAAIVDADLGKFMAATNLFGASIGERKIKMILKVYPDILKKKWKLDKVIEKVMEIEGFQVNTARQFAQGLFLFKEFLKEVPMVQFKKETKATGNRFEGLTIVFTGFRNKEWEQIIEAEGGKVTSSVSKNTSMLVVKETDDSTILSSKQIKAIKLGIPVLSVNKFKNKYKLSI